jgi:hypothetical protein
MQLQTGLFWFVVFFEMPRKQIECFFEGIKIPAYEVTYNNSAIFITKRWAGRVYRHSVVQRISSFVVAGVMNDCLRDFLEKVLNIILEKYGLGGLFCG